MGIAERARLLQTGAGGGDIVCRVVQYKAIMRFQQMIERAQLFFMFGEVRHHLRIQVVGDDGEGAAVADEYALKAL